MATGSIPACQRIRIVAFFATAPNYKVSKFPSTTTFNPIVELMPKINPDIRSLNICTSK
jgi:hypothetical protein